MRHRCIIESENLIDRFLEKTSAYSTREAGRFIGVSHERVNRWRNGARPALQPENERAIRMFLEAPDHPAGDKSRVESMALLIAADRLERMAADLRAEAQGRDVPPPRELTTQVKRAAQAVKAARKPPGRKRAGRKGE